MEVTVRFPDELASRMSLSGGDLSRRALEALAFEEFKSGASPSSSSGGCSVLGPGGHSDSQGEP
jgi:hypothetical protein